MTDPDLLEAYAHCQRLAKSHYENFPVASYLLPARMRPHIAAIYAFARTADDFADEPGRRDDERLRLLEEWRARLDAGTAAPAPDPIFRALAHTIRECHLPVALFHDLLSAFEQDVTCKRYETWPEVLDYCRRSAHPVGRLVLRVAGYDKAHVDAHSDALCTALQLTNFWQDLARDWQIGRIYVPAADRVRLGAREQDLAAGRMTPEWRAVMAEMTLRTRALFTAGRPVCDAVKGRLRFELRLTWLAASRILDRLERSDFDVFRRRPVLTLADVPALMRGMVAWRG